MEPRNNRLARALTTGDCEESSSPGGVTPFEKRVKTTIKHLSSISTRVRYLASLGSTCAVASRIVNENTSSGYCALRTYDESAFKTGVVSSRVGRVDAV